MNRLIFGITLVLAVAVLAVPAHADHDPLTLVPGDADWTSNDTNNLTVSEIEALTGMTDLTSLYKNDVGTGEGGEPFAGSYTTVYSNTPADPSEALITYDGGPAIDTSQPTVLVVKDGNQEPAQYLFDLTNVVANPNAWNGTDPLHLVDFWPTEGAISHIEILGGTGTSVPEPISLLLFGTGLVGIGLVSRKRARL